MFVKNRANFLSCLFQQEFSENFLFLLMDVNVPLWFSPEKHDKHKTAFPQASGK